MRVLGIDPGLRVCGYGCLDVSGGSYTLVGAGVLKTDNSAGMEVKLNSIAEDINQILGKLSPEVVAVEELYSHYAHPRTAILMGHARGVILQKCAEAGIEVRSFSATKIKKSVTGNGSASKEQAQRSIQSILGLSDLPEPADVADAMAAAFCCGDSVRNSAILTGEK